MRVRRWRLACTQRSPGKTGSHFNPKSPLFVPGERNEVLTSTACYAAMAALLAGKCNSCSNRPPHGILNQSFVTKYLFQVQGIGGGRGFASLWTAFHASHTYVWACRYLLFLWLSFAPDRFTNHRRLPSPFPCPFLSPLSPL